VERVIGSLDDTGKKVTGSQVDEKFGFNLEPPDRRLGVRGVIKFPQFFAAPRSDPAAIPARAGAPTLLSTNGEIA